MPGIAKREEEGCVAMEKYSWYYSISLHTYMHAAEFFLMSLL